MHLKFGSYSEYLCFAYFFCFVVFDCRHALGVTHSLGCSPEDRGFGSKCGVQVGFFKMEQNGGFRAAANQKKRSRETRKPRSNAALP